MKFFKNIRIRWLIFFFLLCSLAPLLSQVVDLRDLKPEERSKLPPLMERYLLDEIKQIRSDLLHLKVELIEKVVQKEMSLSRQSLEYAANTVTYFFYVLAGTASLLALVGWQSLREIKSSIKLIADKEIQRLTEEYEKRLTFLEKQLMEKSTLILDNQKEIEKTQSIHSLWVIAAEEVDPEKKIKIYDEILEIVPEDAEVLFAKARAIYSMEEYEWCLNVCNHIIEISPEHANTYYFRACIHCEMGREEQSLMDLELAIELSEVLRDKARSEKSLQSLWSKPEFQSLTGVTEID